MIFFLLRAFANAWTQSHLHAYVYVHIHMLEPINFTIFQNTESSSKHLKKVGGQKNSYVFVQVNLSSSTCRSTEKLFRRMLPQAIGSVEL